MQTVTTHSAEETESFARTLAQTLPIGSALLLTGDLGAGKTNFTRGFLSNWMLGEVVSSPTFTIMNEYRNASVRVFHFDLYRLKSLEEVVELDIEEYIATGDYTLIEWPEIALPIIGTDAIRIVIRLGEDENERTITID